MRSLYGAAQFNSFILCHRTGFLFRPMLVHSVAQGALMHPELASKQRAVSRSLPRFEPLPHRSPYRTFGVLPAWHLSFHDASMIRGNLQVDRISGTC